MALALLAAPTAALVSALRRPWLPVSDWALIELHVREVGTTQTPLVGAYSRFGWHHPGPWPFYLLAGPYRLVGGAHGLLAAAALWNLTMLAATAWVLRRISRQLYLVAAPIIALLVLGLGAGFLSDPWNPSLPVLGVALLVALAHRFATGHRWSAPAMVGVASLLVQAHLGFLVISSAIVVGSIVLHLLGWWSAGRTRAGARSGTDPSTSVGPHPGPRPTGPVVMATVVVVLAAWAPVAVDQLTRHPGNLTLLSRDARRPPAGLTPEEQERIGPGRALGLFARQLGVPGPWMGADEGPTYRDLDPIAGRGRPVDLAGPVLLGALAVVVASRRRDRAALSLLALVAVATLGGFLTLAAIRGPPYGWLVRGLWPLAAWLWIAIGWTLVRALTDTRPQTGSTVDGTALPAAPGAGSHARRSARAPVGAAILSTVAVATLGLVTIGHGTLGQRRLGDRSDLVMRVAAPTVEALEGGKGVFVLPTFANGQETWALAVALDRAGITWTDDLRVAEQRGFRTRLDVLVDRPAIEKASRDGSRLVAVAETPDRDAVGSDVVGVVVLPLDPDGLRQYFGDLDPPVR